MAHADRAYSLRAHRAWLLRRDIAARNGRYASNLVKGLANGVGSSSVPWVGYAASADYVFDMSSEHTSPPQAAVEFYVLLVRALAG